MKKLMLGFLFLGFLLVLLVGGVRRTRAQLARLAEINAGAAGAAEHKEEHEMGETAVSGWQTVTATVTDVRANGLWLQLESGAAARVRRQPWAFAQAEGFAARSGDPIRVQGYHDGTRFEVCTLENPASGQQVQLRDENGRALWSGHFQE